MLKYNGTFFPDTV